MTPKEQIRRRLEEIEREKEALRELWRKIEEQEAKGAPPKRQQLPA